MIPESFRDLAYTISVWFLPAILAITSHEAAHGLVASWLGDDTAKRAGRATLNPIKHIDPFGTIILPGLLLMARAPFMLGWAKPVPIDVSLMRNPRRGMVLVAAAGPGMNVLLALISALILAQLPDGEELGVAAWVSVNLVNSLAINALLAVFNMLPLPPLDGGRVAVGILPNVLARPLARLERYGMMILLGVLLLLPMLAQALHLPINPVGWLIGAPTEALIRLIADITGI